MSYTDKIFVTIALICILAWVSILPVIQIGMGAYKPNHDYWKQFTDKVMAIVAAIFVANGFCFVMYQLWWL